MFVQDDSSAIFVLPASYDLAVHSGQRVRIEGVTAAGDLSPIVTKAALTVLSDVPMPTPASVALEGLFTGQFDCRWIALRGLVQSVTEADNHAWLQVRTSRGSIRVLLAPTISRAQAEKLVDARVTLHGVAGGEWNHQGRLTAVHINVPNLGAIQVDEPPPASPFAIHSGQDCRPGYQHRGRRHDQPAG
jgi:hypothetical protein